MATKTMNIVMRLRDKISQPLTKTSKAMEATKEKIDKTNERLNRLKRSTTAYSSQISKAKSHINNLTEANERNRLELEKNTLELKKYHDENDTANIEAVKAKIAELNQEYKQNTLAIEKANNSIKKYQKASEYKRRAIDKVKVSSSKYKKELGELAKAQKRVEKNFESMRETALRSMDSIIINTGKAGVALGGMAAGVGFNEAFSMEGYQVQIETAVKDTKKASELMIEAVRFANKTPFETGSVVEATAFMETYSVSSKRWLADVADMAGSTNRNVLEATEAMVDATMGEFERIEGFGIRKEMLIAAAAKKYGDNVVFNKKGQVMDELKLQDILQEQMQKKFKGGAEKLSKTAKGLLSTVTGVIKSSLSSILGMQSSGVIKQGSLYEKLKIQIEKVANTLVRWNEDGTIDKIGDSVTRSFNMIFNVLSKVINLIIKYKSFIEPLLLFVGVIYTTVKAFQALQAIMIIVNIVKGLLNKTLAISPLGQVAIVIGVVVGALYLLWRHWDVVTKAVKNAWIWIKEFIGRLTHVSIALLWPIAPILLLIKHFKAIKAVAGRVFDFMKRAIKGFVSIVSKIGNALIEPFRGFFTYIFEKFKALGEIVGKSLKFIKSIFIEEKVTDPGTEEEKDQIKDIKLEKFAHGGITNKAAIFGEAGPEIAIPLNNTPRSKALLNEASKAVGGGSGVTVIIKGDVYGFDDFREKVAEAVVKIYEQVGPNVVGGM